MIRHIYDLPYTQEVTETFTLKDDLVFRLNVFIIGDKYDIASLRRKVVPDFLWLLKMTWQTSEFVECMQKLCGPEAIRLADTSLQAVVADFTADNMSKITYHDSLVKMIKQDKSFTGRVLAGLLGPVSGSTCYLGVCQKPNCSNRTKPDCSGRVEGDPDYLAALNLHCVHCGTAKDTVYNKSGGGQALCTITPKIKVVFM
jgi:hypothetical protein